MCIRDSLYGDEADGYCGDEDNGQTSAWFLFSSLGFYPVAPVTMEYVIGSPLFNYVEISLPNGEKLIIDSAENSNENIYVDHVKLNEKYYNKNWLHHDDLVKGGKIMFNMKNKPNFDWGSSKNSIPYSMSNE